MTHNNENHPDEDDLDLSPELQGVEDTQSLDAIRPDQDDNAITDALFADEDALDEALEIPTLAPSTPPPAPETEYDDALFGSEAELDQALDQPSDSPINEPSVPDTPVADPLFGGDAMDQGSDDNSLVAQEADWSEDECFDDVLFSSDEEIESKAEVPSPTPVKQPEAPRGAADIIRQEVAEMGVKVAKKAPRPAAVSPQANVKTEYKPELVEKASDDFYDDVLFSSEDELEQAVEGAQNTSTQVSDQPEQAFSDALFSDEEALDKALDETTDNRATEKSQEDESETYEDALFSSDDELEQALDQPAAQGSDPESPSGGADVIRQEVADITEQGKADQEAASETLKPGVDEQIEIDPLAFIPHASQEQSDRPGKIYNQFSRMRLVKQGLYDTPALEREDCEVGVTLEAEIRDELEAIADAERAEQEVQKATEEAEEPVEEKTTDKFKKLWKKNREKIDGYLGRTLPDRDISLGFIFPPLKSAKENDIDASTFAVKSIFTKKGTSSATILKRSDAFLAGLVRTQTSDDNRTKIADLFYELLPEHLDLLLQNYYKYPAAPDSKSREAQAESARGVIKNLIVTFKYLYVQLYQANNLIYQNKREQANLLAFRIAELICYEQQLLAVTRVVSDAAVTASFNKLFQALCEYEPAFVQESQQAGFLGEQLSVADIYLRFQALISIDLSCFSAAQQQDAYRYLTQQTPHLQILSTRQLKACDEMLLWVIPDEYNRAPLLVSSQTEVNANALVILAEFMFMQIKRDYAACVDQFGSAEPDVDIPALTGLNIKQQLALLSVFNHRLNELENKLRVPHYTIFDKVDWQLYSGIDDLIYYFESQLPDANLDDMPEDELRKRLLAKRRSGKVQCAVANENDDRINLQVIETEGASDLDVGKVVLILRKNAENGLQEQLVCLVESMLRHQPGKLDLQLLKLADQGINVILKDTDVECSGLLLKSVNQHLLLSDQTLNYWNGKKQTVMLPDGNEYQLNIDALKILNNEFQLLTLL